MKKARTIVIETPNNSGYKFRDMNRAPSQHPGMIIKTARKALGLSQDALAKKVGISQPAIKKIEAGGTAKSRYMPKIAQVLNLQMSNLDNTLDQVNHTPGKPDTARNQTLVRVKTDGLMGDITLPVYGSAQGGRGALIVTTEPVDWVSRPQPLERVKDGYGIIISESSMEPEFEPGDVALIHPHKPAIPGKSCVFYSEKPDGTTEAVIKRLRKETPDAWHVRQFNPRKDFILKKSEWQKAHLTVGKFTSG